MVEEVVKQEKWVPKENCIRFWESMLFHDKAFLPVETTVIIQSTIKHLKEGVENGSHKS